MMRTLLFLLLLFGVQAFAAVAPGWRMHKPTIDNCTPDTYVHIALDSADRIWTTFQQSYGDTVNCAGMAVHISDTVWQVFNKENSELPTNKIKRIEAIDSNLLWCITDSGLIRFDSRDGSCKRLTPQNSGIFNSFIANMAIAADKSLWVVNPNFGLGIQKIVNDTVVYVNHYFPILPVDMLGDTNGNVWVVGGTANWDAFTRIGHDDSIYQYPFVTSWGDSITDFKCIQPAENGVIWLGLGYFI
ncbi:MAG: hypothetical protein A2268_00630 [Candidatus Raymondbacteria bacterium RifOxyA12_full_50_37]|nr:MAG: hypothetical protein A2268_00630 [Candidatus Raymondbacteria bacterium RifOxyA12_full_50_37]